MEFEVTKMGEKGQIVIPSGLRKELHLEKGEKIIVMKHNETLLLKKMQPPSLSEFDAMLREGKTRAGRLKLTQKDLDNARKRSRSKK